MQDKLPPQNIEAEQMILGSVLLDNRVIKKIELANEDFYKTSHQKIFRVMKELNNQNVEIDLITLTDKLTQRGQIEEIGGASYLSEMATMTPTSANIKNHVSIVREKSQRRVLLRASIEIFDKIDNAEIDELKRILLSSIKETRANTKIIKPDVFTKEIYEYIEKIIHRKKHSAGVPMGIPSGFIEIDRMTGGWQAPELIILAGRPGMAKTACKDNLASYAAEQGYPVGIFELEMGEHQTGLRLFSNLGDIPLNNLKYGTMDNYYKQLINATKKSAELPIYRCYATLNIEQIYNHVEVMVGDFGVKIVMIDYLQLIIPSFSVRREEQVAHVSRIAKQIAKDFNIPVVCLAQLNRSCESREDKRPLLSDLRESGAIEQDADIVIFLYRDDYYKKDFNKGVAEFLFSKNRNGETGRVKLTWQPEFTRFKDLVEETYA